MGHARFSVRINQIKSNQINRLLYDVTSALR